MTGDAAGVTPERAEFIRESMRKSWGARVDAYIEEAAPNTAAHLRESKRNVLKDFVHIAGPLGVTHFVILTATQNASYLRIAKSPRVRRAPVPSSRPRSRGGGWAWGQVEAGTRVWF